MARRDDSWWLVAASLIVLAMSEDNKSIPWGSGWVWPIPDLKIRTGAAAGSYRAALSQEWRPSGAGVNPVAGHYGVDLMYRSGSPPPAFFVPEGVPVLAARAGTLWSVQRTPRGIAVVIDHGKPFATFYQHLESADASILDGVRGTPIAAGQRIGTVGIDPLDAARIRHLHFAVWWQGSGDAASVDPAPVMSTWGRSSWTV